MANNIIFSPQERSQFLSTYRLLYPSASPLFSAQEWRAIKAFVRRGIEAGVYSPDERGINRLLWRLQTCWTIVSKVGLRQASLICSMLYPLAEHDVVSREEVQACFGEDAVHLMSCMGRVKEMYRKHDSLEDENFRKLLLSMAEDLRVIICLIADRYVLMKMLNHHPDTAFRLEVTRQCRLLYTPMSHRLGLYAIKQELEDMAVKYEHREVYDQIAHDLDQTKKARESYIKAFIEPLERRLHEAAPEMKFHIKGRTKSISSIWNKLKNQQTTLDKIYDLFAIRIIIDQPDPHREKADCWHAYSIVTDMYTPNPARMKNWISIPKSNGYESLHVTVKGPENRWVEVQIRTTRMDEVAEHGLAAHWLYKGIKSQGEADRVMASIREILEQNANPDELMRDLNLGLYKEEIFVFTPRGDVFRLPKGATVLDLAFSIHSGLGCQCVGARVSGKNVKLNHPLQSGDTVEIHTSAQQSPKQDWLNIVVTGKARTRIKQAIKEVENREAENGRELLQRRCKNRRIELDESSIHRLVPKMGYKTLTEFYHALAIGSFTVDDVLRQWEEMQSPIIQGEPEPHSAGDFDIEKANANALKDGQEARLSSSSDTLVIDRDLKGLDYKLAGCCHPIYGDEVVGFVSISGGIRIHRADCVNIRCMQQQYPYRIVRARWSGKSGAQYSITLRVVGQDDIGIVSNISSVINKEKDTLLRAIAIDTEGGLFQGHLTVMVNDLSSLTILIRKIKNVKGVKQVERVS